MKMKCVYVRVYVRVCVRVCVEMTGFSLRSITVCHYSSRRWYRRYHTSMNRLDQRPHHRTYLGKTESCLQQGQYRTACPG